MAPRTWEQTPPRWLFHVPYVVVASAMVWSAGAPGYGTLPPEMAAFILPMVWAEDLMGMLPAAGSLFSIGLAVAWLARVLVVSSNTRSWSRWFLVAPAIGLLVLADMVTGASLRLRWELSKPEFQQALVETRDSAADDGSWPQLAGRIGLYDVIEVSEVPGLSGRRDGVLFVEAHGGLLDDVGFAHLPSGPDPDNQGCLHLGDDWYIYFR